MTQQNNDLLLVLCKLVYEAQKSTEQDRKREMFKDRFFPELLVRRVDAIKIEIRKENVNHHDPHMHITHSDKIDVSLSLTDFRVLAGNIDRKSLKKLQPMLDHCQPHLMQIWNALNVGDNSAMAEILIENIP